MCTLYVSSQAVSVKLDSECLLLHDHRVEGPERVKRVPLCKVERIVVCGAPAVTMPALVEAMDRGIDCTFVTAGGRWRGRLATEASRNGFRRRRQYACGLDGEFNLKIAKRIVEDKISNSAKALGRLFKNRGMYGSGAWKELSGRLAGLAAECAAAEDVDWLRGIEGDAGAEHFAALGEFFPADLPFRGRSRRPPRDAANALLSFGYGMLAGEMECAIQRHGLDPALGFMHSDDKGRASLALDLMEPFRPALVDLAVMNMANHGVFDAEEDFEETGADGVLLSESGRKKFFRGWEQALARGAEAGACAFRTGMRGAIDRQVTEYAKLVEGAPGEREFFRMK